MNLKIAENSIIFRITEGELTFLLGQGRVEKQTPILGRSVTMVIHSAKNTNGAHLEITHDEKGPCFLMTAPQDDIEKLFSMGKDREGLKYTQQEISIYLQVDVKKDTRHFINLKDRI